MRKLFLILIISALLFSCVYAVDELSNFKVDDKLYDSNFNGSDCIIYFDDTNSSGMGIFKYLDNDCEDDDDDAIDNILIDDGDDYLEADEDYKLTKNPDNTANFTDLDNNNRGIVELVDVNNEKFVIVFWAKNDSSIDNEELISQLNDFNKNNDVSPISF